MIPKEPSTENHKQIIFGNVVSKWGYDVYGLFGAENALNKVENVERGALGSDLRNA